MSAGCPDLPIVVFPANNEVRARTRPAAPVRAALRDATASLRHLHTALLNPGGANDVLRKATDDAVDQVRRLAIEAVVPPMDTAPLKPIVPHHIYFGIRTAPLHDPYLVSEVTTVGARVLADIRHARLGLNDRDAEVCSMIRLLEGLDPGPGAPAQHPTAASAGTGTLYEPGHDELTRWIIAHQLYLMLTLAAADSVNRAVTALKAGERETAHDALHEAAMYVRGFTAAMVHAGDMSAPCYGARVRPTMQPPALPEALSGGVMPEPRAFRKAMRTLVKVSCKPFDMLITTDPELAFARDALLEADLINIERHVIVAADQVGTDSSIVRHDPNAESAVASLRMMRHARAVTYRDLMRFGDPVSLTNQ
ncbi:hypothetical protein [Streptomyces sp. NBC_01304]|uniref:hypothetical protein n=1 Tax=Streptomyces sp. NBC_01304 TaxID=2903818 RepID=UPI002E15668A|nr:hypothetical protein OG430_05170 [Streptomyces sp. NBC_01304]